MSIRRLIAPKSGWPAQILPWVALAACCFVWVYAWTSHLRIVTSWKDSYASFVNFGDPCDYTVGLWDEARDTFESVRTRPHEFQPGRMPYRLMSSPPVVPVGGYIYARCRVDLSKLDRDDFAWMSLGVLLGDAAVYLGDKLKLRQADNGMAEFALLPDEIASTHDVSVIARRTDSADFPGLASLVPLAATSDRLVLQRVQFENLAWRSEMPMLRIGYACAIFMVFAALWVWGARYADVGWMIVLSALVAGTAFVEHHPVGLRPIISYKLANMLTFSVLVVLPIFVVSFLRWRTRPWVLEGIALGAVAVFGLASTQVSNVHWAFLTYSIPRYVGAVALLVVAFVALRHAKEVSGRRVVHVRLVTGIAVLGAVAMVVDAMLNMTTSISLSPFVYHGLLTAFALLTITDLVIFQREYFVERARRLQEEERARDLEQGLEMGQAVQRLLMPAVHEAKTGLGSYRFFFEPSQQMAGDWFQVWETPSGELRLLIGDVVGKGAQAALAVSVIVSVIADAKSQDLAAVGCIQRIHQQLAVLFNHHINTTLAMVCLGPEGRLTLHNCGSLGWFVLSPEGVDYVALRGGAALGGTGEAQIESSERRVRGGETLFSFTDGCLDGSRATRRLIKALEEAPREGLSPKHLFDTVLGVGADSTLEDDRTMVTLRVGAVDRADVGGGG